MSVISANDSEKMNVYRLTAASRSKYSRLAITRSYFTPTRTVSTISFVPPSRLTFNLPR